LRKGEVRVNKGRIKPEYKLQAGDIVRVPPVRLPERDEPAPVAQGLLQRLEAAIVYEDKALIVMNKPAGIAVHGGSGLSFGVIEALRQLRPDAKELELVHRLDRDTSGLLMIAKKRSMLRHLHAACAAMVSTSATWRWCVATGRPRKSRSMRRCSRATCVPASAWSR
jgi:23S rRNA pseudouridine955/2504/2580 synthase